jgi:hypothetical protein
LACLLCQFDDCSDLTNHKFMQIITPVTIKIRLAIRLNIEYRLGFCSGATNNKDLECCMRKQ